ncbi:hypothetical protein G3I78_21505 [Streptomyces sp. SID13726]|nr:hypothetical protein [Streptomyces sp. SID13726]
MMAPAHADGNRVECTKLSNGTLCISLNTSPSRIEVFYNKDGGGTITAHLGFRSSAGTTYGAKKTISAHERANSTWNISYPCRPYVGLLKVDGQGTFETPKADC